jgi:hypothetical protein
LRELFTPSDKQPKLGTTIYQSADKPIDLKEDAILTKEVVEIREDIDRSKKELNPSIRLRKRGIPYWLANKFYHRTGELMEDPELTVGGQKQLAQAVNMIAKVDVETARFQLGEAAVAQVNVNQVQTSPAELMKSYLNEVQDRISAAYPPPPTIEAEFSSEPTEVSDMSDEIAEAIKAEVPALRSMNGALTKIVKKVMEDKKLKEKDNGSSSS